MATISILYRYCYLLVVFSSFMFLPLCYSGKMRRKPKHDGIMRSIKILDRKYNRKVQNARTPEEFLKIFHPRAPQLMDPAGLRRLQVDDQNITNDMEEVVLSIEQTSCVAPRPVLLDAHDVLGINKGRLQWVLPSCLEVNRCGAHSGCCRDQEICSVKEGSTRNATKKVMIFTLDYVSRQADRESRTIEVEEHTECECRLLDSCKNLNCRRPHIRDMQRCACICPKLCPEPYVHNDTCGCKCGEAGSYNAGKCWRIYRGKKEMEEKYCRCVRSGQCAPPTCKTKYIFNNETCTCVRKPNTSTSERIADPYGALFQAELNVRATDDARPSAIPVGLLVRSRNNHQDPKKVAPAGESEYVGDPKLGSLSPEANKYRHSSHTSYNDTFDNTGKHNVTRKHKTKVSTLMKSGDESNATFIKDEYTLQALPNGTEHETVFDPVISEETNTQVIPNALPEKEDTSYGGENVMNTYWPATNVDDLKLFSSASSSEYSFKFSYSYDDKSEDNFGFEFRTPNEDQENYEYDGSGYHDLGAY